MYSHNLSKVFGGFCNRKINCGCVFSNWLLILKADIPLRALETLVKVNTLRNFLGTMLESSAMLNGRSVLLSEVWATAKLIVCVDFYAGY